jgi:hypothetical protein
VVPCYNRYIYFLTNIHMVPLLKEAIKPFSISAAIVAFSALCGNLLAVHYGVNIIASAI